MTRRHPQPRLYHHTSRQLPPPCTARPAQLHPCTPAQPRPCPATPPRRGDPAQISQALLDLGITSSKTDLEARTKLGYSLFDTTGKRDPLDPDGSIKQAAVQAFPPDLFFVLRVIQLLRGMAGAMGVQGLSTAKQWGPLARRALRERRKCLHSGAPQLRAG
jgi:hypothetical protein